MRGNCFNYTIIYVRYTASETLRLGCRHLFCVNDVDWVQLSRLINIFNTLYSFMYRLFLLIYSFYEFAGRVGWGGGLWWKHCDSWPRGRLLLPPNQSKSASGKIVATLTRCVWRKPRRRILRLIMTSLTDE